MDDLLSSDPYSCWSSWFIVFVFVWYVGWNRYISLLINHSCIPHVVDVNRCKCLLFLFLPLPSEIGWRTDDSRGGHVCMQGGPTSLTSITIPSSVASIGIEYCIYVTYIVKILWSCIYLYLYRPSLIYVIPMYVTITHIVNVIRCLCVLYLFLPHPSGADRWTDDTRG